MAKMYFSPADGTPAEGSIAERRCARRHSPPGWWRGAMAAALVGLAGLGPTRGDIVYLMLTNQGYINGHKATLLSGCPAAGDSVTVPIIVLTDCDTPPGTHSITFPYSGPGGHLLTDTFEVEAGGALEFGGVTSTNSILTTLENYTSAVGPAVPIPDQIPPFPDSSTDYPPIGWVPPPVTGTATFYLDYNSTTQTAFESEPLQIVSLYEWNDWLWGPDSIFGYQDVFYVPTRTVVNFTSPIEFYIPDGLDQDPFGKDIYPPGDGGCSTCGCGMAVASLDRFQAGISITDTPISYTPPVGSSMPFQITYHQRLSNQPATLNYSNLGKKWSFNWLSYVSGGPANSSSQAIYYAPDGSQYTFGGYEETPPPSGSPTYQYQGDFEDNQGWTHETLHYRQNPQRYELWEPDGTVKKFSQATGTSTNQVFFLTSVTDPQGNTTTINYSQAQAALGNAVITSVTDPLGNQLSFSYGGANPLEITKVTRSIDGKSASFGYNSAGQLVSSTDPSGIVSSFQYSGTHNFISRMTTPYGDTTFHSSDGTSGSTYLEADMTNPLGQTERVEYQASLSTSDISDYGAAAPTASGLVTDGTNLATFNSFYWSRRAIQDAVSAGYISSGTNAVGTATNPAAFYGLAETTHWAKSGLGSIPLALSVKKPLESRVWYNYPQQSDSDHVILSNPGTSSSPSITARLVNSGSGSVSQVYQAGYNSNGLITQSIDPIGRTTNYTYATNGIDLTQVSQTDGTNQDVLGTMTYNSQHEPLTSTDASGQTTTMTYNSQGQLLTVTDPLHEMTSNTYTGNLLTEVTAPLGATTVYTYTNTVNGGAVNPYLVSTVTDSLGYKVTYSYDNLDRPVKVSYPDGTSDQRVYKNLDVVQTIDRQGRVTTNQYDAIRELLQTTDPQGRTTKYSWCSCGGLSTLTDANGNVTGWGLDTEGRVTSKTYAVGTSSSTSNTYVYESDSSRLHTMTDAKSNVSTYAYNADNTLASVNYTTSTNTAATPNVSFTYDSVYNRVASMTDGTGTTSYTYNAITGAATLGAGRLASVSVPMAGSTATVGYGYDALGRVQHRAVDALTTQQNNVTTTFDALGRVTNVTNALGSFGYGYLGESGLLASITYPSGTGLSTTNSYYTSTNSQDLERLQEIKNLNNGAVMSKFDYTYNAVGTIASWQQQADTNTPTVYALGYDNADELISATNTLTGSNTVLNYNNYVYDPAGNRISETASNGTSTNTTPGQFNGLNQLIALGTTTNQTVAGYVSGTNSALSGATVDNVPATISQATNFTATIPLPGGTNLVSIIATPSSTNAAVASQVEEIVTPGTAPTQLTYDANGNCTTDENGNTYTWDALNRLISITYSGGASSNFAYDGLSRRTSIIEKNSSGTVTSTKNYLWIGSEIAEERDADNNVTKRFFPQGEQQSGTNYYYTRDQVASVREMLNGSGTIVARYGYDAFGAPLPGYSTNLISGTNLATFQYATMMMHQPSGISFTRNVPGFDGREYNPSVGWISRDPLGEGWDATLYSYVYNNPIWAFDPFGLAGPGRHFSPATNTVVINDPLGAFLLFLLGNHTPAEIGSGLAGALATLQKENSDYFPKTTCPTNVTWYSYGSWNHPLDTLDAMLTLGQYRYNNDGTTTTISDFYSFPFSQDDNYGGTTYHNAGLSPLGIINSGYPVSGQYPTP